MLVRRETVGSETVKSICRRTRLTQTRHQYSPADKCLGFSYLGGRTETRPRVRCPISAHSTPQTSAIADSNQNFAARGSGVRVEQRHTKPASAARLLKLFEGGCYTEGPREIVHAGRVTALHHARRAARALARSP